MDPAINSGKGLRRETVPELEETVPFCPVIGSRFISEQQPTPDVGPFGQFW